MGFPSFSAGEVLTAADMNAVGLWLVKTQTIGTAVSSVTVSNAFSASYDNYLIKISGGVGSTGFNMQFRLGASTTAYYSAGVVYAFAGLAAVAAGDNNAAQYTRAGTGGVNGLSMTFYVNNPFLAARTILVNPAYSPTDTASSAGFFNGFHNVATSYSDFTLIPSAGTMTGGTIRVYGYRN
jgi:hypothetical protein